MFKKLEMNDKGRAKFGWAVFAATIVGLSTVFASFIARGENPGKRKAGVPPGVAEKPSTSNSELPNPIVQLSRDPLVHSELRLSQRQIEAINNAYAQIEQPMWRLRDVTSGPGAAEKEKLAGAMETALRTILNSTQQTRVRQLVFRARGWEGIDTPTVAAELELSADQMQNIKRVVEQTRHEIQTAANSNDSPAARETAAVRLRTKEGSDIQQLLSDEQRKKLAELVGRPFDLSQVRPLTFQSPELAQIDDWINTSPVRLADLRGKVVAVHFWAFNCVNCVHNLPHYNNWHDRFSTQGLVVLGLHTPETQAERDLAALRKSVQEHDIRYPVAVDHEGQNWAAWANSMWPSVYLVDKRGQVRYWWYGEMNWQGIEGENFMRNKIEQLLAEK
ncbi:MAG: redoxin domain-containing protein [Planctomycetia bacterium]|nr:redoxin domain-containing protein [Planctomycetia bacterium]